MWIGKICRDADERLNALILCPYTGHALTKRKIYVLRRAAAHAEVHQPIRPVGGNGTFRLEIHSAERYRIITHGIAAAVVPINGEAHIGTFFGGLDSKRDTPERLCVLIYQKLSPPLV